MIERKVICIDNMQIYDGVMDAARRTNTNRSSVGKVCRGERYTANGLKFMYLDKYELSKNNNLENTNLENNNLENNNLKISKEVIQEKIVSLGKNKVICIDTKEIFDGVMDASRKLNINRNSIGKVCRGEQHTAGGLKFMYLNKYEDTLNIDNQTKQEEVFIENNIVEEHSLENNNLENNTEIIEETIENLLDDKIVDERADEDMKVINLDLASIENKTQEEWFELWLQESKYKNYAEFEEDIKKLWQEIQLIGRKIRRDRVSEKGVEL